MIKKVFCIILKSMTFLLLFLFIIAIGGLSALLVFQNIFSVPNVTVPSVVNDHIDVAQEKIYNAGLKIIVSGEEYNTQTAKNTIIKQKPDPGFVIKKNREVEVTLSKGRKILDLTVPDLKNKNIDEAVSIIEAYGLVLGRVTFTNHFSIPKDQVIAQVPEPGDISSEDNKVNLLISRGNY